MDSFLPSIRVGKDEKRKKSLRDRKNSLNNSLSSSSPRSSSSKRKKQPRVKSGKGAYRVFVKPKSPPAKKADNTANQEGMCLVSINYQLRLLISIPDDQKEGPSRKSSSKLSTAIALKSLANHFSIASQKRRRRPDTLPLTLKTRPGTPNRNGYRFLKKNSRKVLPQQQQQPTPTTSVSETSSSTTKVGSKALLAAIPICGLQKCLMKYGCGHCM